MVITFALIGIAAGVSSGLFGLGGGVLIVPALVYFAGFGQERAVGTSLAVLLPPVGLAAVVNYYRHGSVDLPAALWVAAGLFLGAWLGSMAGIKMGEAKMRLGFGIFMILLGTWVCLRAWKGIGPEMH